jgi:hypothetical protein
MTTIHCYACDKGKMTRREDGTREFMKAIYECDKCSAAKSVCLTFCGATVHWARQKGDTVGSINYYKRKTV